MNTITKLTTALLALAAAATGASAMFGGTVVEQPPTTGMVFVQIGSECTGTLLSPRWVLTARHCLDPRFSGFGEIGLIAAPVARDEDDPKHRWDRSPIDRGPMWTRAAIRDRFNPRYLVAGVESFGQYRQPLLWSIDSVGAPVELDAPHGMVSVELAGIDRSELTALTTVAGGDIIAAGWAETDGALHLLVIRFDRHGMIKMASHASATAPDGFVPVFDAAQLGSAAAVAADGAGNVVVVGSRLQGGIERWVAVMFDAAGARRPMFEYLETAPERGRLVDVEIVGGKVVVTGISKGQPVVAVLGATAVESRRPLGGGMNVPRALAVDSAQRIVVAGRDHGQRRVVVARFTSAGGLAPDLTFDGDGVTVRSIEEPDMRAEIVGVEAAPGDDVMVGLGLRTRVETATMTALRFTAAGQPDESFGQSGLIVWHENAASVEAGGFALGPETAVLFGRSTRGALAAVAYKQDYDPVAEGGTVTAGDGVTVDVVRAKVHPDASVDVALLELAEDVVEADVRFGGFADPTPLLLGTSVVCYGAGLDGPNNTGRSGTLRRGELSFDALDDSRLVALSSICPKGQAPCKAVTQNGDSGGACFLGDTTATWQLLGVTRSSRHRDLAERTFEPASLRQHLTRGDFIAEWVARETAD